MGRPRKPPQYTVETVEATLDLRIPGRWRRQAVGWQVDTPEGTIAFPTLKEVRAFALGLVTAKAGIFTDQEVPTS